MNAQKRPFAADVRRHADIAIIDMHGDIDSFAEDHLNDAYTTAAHVSDAVVLNFSDVDYINSTGIALIVGLLAQARKKRLQLRTYGLSEHYQEIFRITRLSDFMAIYPDETAAITA